MNKGNLLALIGFKMSLEFVVPFVHSVDLVLVLLLSGACGNVSFCPFSVSGGNLFGSFGRVLAVVSVPFGFTSFSVRFGSAMGEVFFIVVASSLFSTFEVLFHTSGVFFKFCYPGILAGQPFVPFVEEFCREFGQSFETLEGVSWGHFSIISGGDGGEDGE